MFSCPVAPSRYLKQCWLIICDVLYHSHQGNFTGNAQDTYSWYEFENYSVEIKKIIYLWLISLSASLKSQAYVYLKALDVSFLQVYILCVAVGSSCDVSKVYPGFGCLLEVPHDCNMSGSSIYEGFTATSRQHNIYCMLDSRNNGSSNRRPNTYNPQMFMVGRASCESCMFSYLHISINYASGTFVLLCKHVFCDAVDTDISFCYIIFPYIMPIF